MLAVTTFVRKEFFVTTCKNFYENKRFVISTTDKEEMENFKLPPK